MKIELPEDLEEMLVEYLKNAQNALVNISSEITKIKNAKEAQLKQMDDALKYYTDRKVEVEQVINKLLSYGLVAPEPEPEQATEEEKPTEQEGETGADDSESEQPTE